MSAQWREQVLDPRTMSTEDIRDELRHDLDVYDRVRHPLSREAMGARISRLTDEMDERVQAAKANGEAASQDGEGS